MLCQKQGIVYLKWWILQPKWRDFTVDVSKNDEFVLQTRDCVLKMMNIAAAGALRGRSEREDLSDGLELVQGRA